MLHPFFLGQYIFRLLLLCVLGVGAAEDGVQRGVVLGSDFGHHGFGLFHDDNYVLVVSVVKTGGGCPLGGVVLGETEHGGTAVDKRGICHLSMEIFQIGEAMRLRELFALFANLNF